MRRRHFLTISTSAIGGAIISTIGAQDGTFKVPLRFFTRDEALDVAAAASRIFPSDATGPGANEAGVVIYIDRQLAGPYGRDVHRYTQPPFESGPPELGYQGSESPAQIYRTGLKQIGGLRNLDTTRQDAVLKQIEKTLFFQLLRTHTIEGMFCDPVHGGNAGMIGWQLIGFPGPRMSYSDEVEAYNGRPFRPKPRSLRQISGHATTPSEDES